MSGAGDARVGGARVEGARVGGAVRLAWGVAAVGTAAFAALAIVVSNGLGDALDRRVLLALRGADGAARGPDWFVESVSDVTALGGYPVIGIAVAFAIAALAAARQRTAIAFLLGAIVGGSVLSTALKLVFVRGRPDLVEHLDRTFTSSFPSAHAMVSMLAWLTLAAVLVRFVRAHRMRVLLVSAAVLLSVLIGASRVYLGVHWPSDVLAGWSAGLAWASACWLAAHYLSERPRRIDRLGASAG